MLRTTCISLLSFLMMSTSLALAAPPERDSTFDPNMSPYEAGRLRAELTTTLNENRNYVGWIDSLLRALRSFHNAKQIMIDVDREGADIRGAISAWTIALGGKNDLQSVQRAASAALEKFQSSVRPNGTFGVYDSRRMADFANYLRFGTNAVTQQDILTYVTAIDVAGLNPTFATAFDEANTSVQNVLDSRKTDACYDFYVSLTRTRLQSNDDSKSTLERGFAACNDDAEARTKFLRGYYDTMGLEINKIVEILNAALTKARNNVQDLTQKLRKLSEIEARADKEYRTRDRTVIDESAIWIISITLFAWMLIIATVVFAIIYMGRRDGRQEGAPPSSPSQPFNYVLFLEMMTVFILTATILILGLGGKLQNEALAALIGGISGYVLGRIHTSNRGERSV